MRILSAYYVRGIVSENVVDGIVARVVSGKGSDVINVVFNYVYCMCCIVLFSVLEFYGVIVFC